MLAHDRRRDVSPYKTPRDASRQAQRRGGFCKSLYVDGEDKQMNFANAWTGGWGTTNRGAFLIGMHPGAVYWGNLDGYISEIAVYTNALSAVERILVQNAIAARNMETDLLFGERYIGDRPAQGDYDLDVFGIGSLGSSDKVSAGGLAGFGITERFGSLGNDEWVLAGHRVGNNSRVDLEGAAAGSGGKRWARVWYVDVTGEVSVRLTFDRGDAGLAGAAHQRYALLYASSPSLSPWTIVDWARMIDGDRVSFDLDGSQLISGYYTLAEYPQGSMLIIR